MPDAAARTTQASEARAGARPAERSPDLRPAAGAGEAGEWIVDLQRSIGNRATGRLLDREWGSGASPPDPTPIDDPHEVMTQLGGGRSLPGQARSPIERSFGRGLAGVRLHTGPTAHRLAGRLDARAFAVGPHVAFARGEYRPGTPVGDALLAHELAHTEQQRTTTSGSARTLTAGGPAHEHDATSAAAAAMRSIYAPALAPSRGPSPAGRDAGSARPRLGAALSLQRCGASPPRVETRPATEEDRREMVQTAIRYLEDMAELIADQTRAAFTDARGARGDNDRWVETLLERLEELLGNGTSVYEAQQPLVPEGDPLRTQLRDAWLQVLLRPLEAGRAAYRAQAGSGDADSRRQRRTDYVSFLGLLRETALSTLLTGEGDEQELRDDAAYAEFMAAWIEASPMTSADLAGERSPTEEDAEAAGGYETQLEAFLDDLLTRLPGLELEQAEKDRIYERLIDGLRRANLTIAAGPHGRIDVRTIPNDRIAGKVRRVVALLVEQLPDRPELNLILTSPPAIQLPDPVPDVSPELASEGSIGQVDLGRVPADERPSVQYGLLELVRSSFPQGSTESFVDSYWPVTLPVRRGAQVEHVRYEVIFDSRSNVTVERLGIARQRDVDPAFASLGLAEKKARLVTEFGLAAVDDRPAYTPGPQDSGTPRAASSWRPEELDQIRAAYELLPQRDRDSLQGVTLVRDGEAPQSAQAGETRTGFAHIGANDTYDEPGPPDTPPPHIHYFDAAFDENAVLAVGPPGSSGPGGDWWLTHEVGHFRIFRATLRANAAIDAANQRGQAARPALQRVPFADQAQRQAWNTWSQATGTANQAIVAYNQALGDYNDALDADPPPAQHEIDDLLEAAQNALTAAEAAVAARDQARPALAAAAFPQAVIDAADENDAADDELLAASQSLAAAGEQIDTFVTLAGRFGLHRFSDYARRGGDDEFFAETYALYVTDPDRLNEMSRSIFLWFEAGMPMDPSWQPAR